MRTWHVNRMVYVKRDLMLATYKRNVSLFRRVIFETVIMSLLSSLIYATHRYLKERLSLIWREKLTKQLHEKYFTSMNYYRLSHLNRGEIADVEERIVKDPRRFCKSLAEEMEKASAAVTSGLWFTQADDHLVAALCSGTACLLLLQLEGGLIVCPMSVKWRRCSTSGASTSTQGRLQTHAELSAPTRQHCWRNIIETAWDKL